jgi:hypothetical protein
MVYSKTDWKDRIVQKPLTYTMQQNADGTITLIPVPGTITQEGTPVNAAYLNKIEQGLIDAHNGQMYKLTKDDGKMLILPNGTDLNTVFDTGIYYANVTTINNPFNNNVVLEVMRYSDTTTTQRATAMNTATPNVWTRHCSNGTWGVWFKIQSLTKDGILNIPTQPYFFASTGVDKAVSSGVDTKVVLAGVTNDNYGEFINGVYIPKESGTYLISVYVKWLAVVNGVTSFKFFNGGNPSLDLPLGHNTKLAAFARPVSLTAGVPLETYINQDSGASATMDLIVMYVTKLS